MQLSLDQLSPTEAQQWLQHAIAPRPIAFASTCNAAGQVNLSPFSFFNLFSSNPPIVIFSPARRARDGSTKHTLQNVLEWPEVVINICNYAMVQQMSLASCEYPAGVDEFVKSGFTKAPSVLVRPPRVLESPVALECRVNEVKSLGDGKGAGQLVIAEVLLMHVHDEVLGSDGKIDLVKMQHVARLGGDWYCRTGPENLFTVPKPHTRLGIGVDALPPAIRLSKVLSGNHLGMLANVHELPLPQPAFHHPQLAQIGQYFGLNPADLELETQRLAATLLDEGKVAEAWQVLLYAHNA